MKPAKRRPAGKPVARPGYVGHRYPSIVDMERHLDANGTRVIKIYLH